MNIPKEAIDVVKKALLPYIQEDIVDEISTGILAAAMPFIYTDIVRKLSAKEEETGSKTINADSVTKQAYREIAKEIRNMAKQEIWQGMTTTVEATMDYVASQIERKVNNETT